MLYDTQIKISLKGSQGCYPQIAVGLDDTVLVRGKLHKPQEFGWHHHLHEGTHRIWVDLLDKTDDSPDQFVEIEWVEIEGMRLDRVKWRGVYEPRYPESWASQQKDLPARRVGETYLGWNGRWTLDFSVPIYTWLHEVEHLGWLYR
jgi:hypothetical protein